MHSNTEPLDTGASGRPVRHLVATEAAMAATGLDGWQQRYQQLTPGHFLAQVQQATYGDVHVFRERTNLALLEEGEARRGYLSIALPHRECADGWFSGYRMSGDTVLRAGNGQPLAMRTPPSLDLLGVTLPLPALQRVMEREGVPELIARLRPATEVRRAASEDFRAAMLAVLAASAMQSEVFNQRFVESAMRDALLMAVVSTLTHDIGDALLPTPPARRRLVAQAYEMVRAAPEAPWSVLALCERLGVSRRTLQYSFNEVTGLAPLEFVRALRMNGVRQALGGRQAQEPVGVVAARWGFNHLPRFAAQYRAFFGELPSETAGRGR
ncbi:helix-turn-helix domain-containing protein [Cupriavidus basilensis]|uniref:helix-turn-helix domain-containing protein n=1 Tax=Cupriavidus basilensis TaxID=68895 RepID=UPI00157BAD7A|nr:helix-turn-helix domain-containing protein [Cupriavidus basilensis]NUA26457.1 helix-turn-helix domain-containing protein [Cupriavidus basilensis]